MKALTCQQMREMDRKTIAEYGTPGEVLMDRAGMEAARLTGYLARVIGYDDTFVLLLAGRGNNGGDAFAAARYLKEEGFEPEVWLACEASAVDGDALKHLTRMKAAGIPLHEFPAKRDWEDAIAGGNRSAGIVIDGILGTGISGPARGPAAGAICYVNAISNESFVLSLDIPSGLNGDTGEAQGDVVVADVTITMGHPKRGLLEPRALKYVGSVTIADIGIPHELSERADSDLELITGRELRAIFGRRPRDAHKGDFGHVLIIGGAPGYSGAAALATRAALRSGAGLVSALVPASIAHTVAVIAPEAMVHGGAQSDSGSLSADCITKWNRDLDDFGAVLIGPGLTVNSDTAKLVEDVISRCRCPLIVDADAINACVGRLDLLRSRTAPTIITPHPGELGRLMGTGAAQVQSDRFASARKAAELTNAIVVLKGGGTLVAVKDKRLNVNLTGNPGMATGGMGDVLAGIITGLAVQAVTPFDAAAAGVYLHGRAGDIAAWRISQPAVLASDVVEDLSLALREISVR